MEILSSAEHGHEQPSSSKDSDLILPSYLCKHRFELLIGSSYREVGHKTRIFMASTTDGHPEPGYWDKKKTDVLILCPHQNTAS